MVCETFGLALLATTSRIVVDALSSPLERVASARHRGVTVSGAETRGLSSMR
ncbi:hypothetical protein [Natrinema sp. H-ect4]|uniref:hypothetical protein n=1 Tax=Natrinema sp. H-ect4 TaxID=3242699 RepID=UPI0035A8185C